MSGSPSCLITSSLVIPNLIASGLGQQDISDKNNVAKNQILAAKDFDV
jgi:hypothetical protein